MLKIRSSRNSYDYKKKKKRGLPSNHLGIPNKILIYPFSTKNLEKYRKFQDS